MKFFLFLIAFAVAAFSWQMANGQPYKKIHARAILVDTHNDLLSKCIDDNTSFDDDLRGKTQSDLKRFSEGGIDVQVIN